MAIVLVKHPAAPHSWLEVPGAPSGQSVRCSCCLWPAPSKPRRSPKLGRPRLRFIGRPRRVDRASSPWPPASADGDRRAEFALELARLMLGRVPTARERRVLIHAALVRGASSAGRNS